MFSGKLLTYLQLGQPTGANRGLMKSIPSVLQAFSLGKFCGALKHVVDIDKGIVGVLVGRITAILEIDYLKIAVVE